MNGQPGIGISVADILWVWKYAKPKELRTSKRKNPLKTFSMTDDPLNIVLIISDKVYLSDLNTLAEFHGLFQETYLVI